MAILLDGKAVSAELRERLRVETEALRVKARATGLAVIIAGEDPASQIYVRNKEKACEELGYRSEVYRLSADVTMEELEALVERLNADPEIDGVLPQSPMPRQIDMGKIFSKVDPGKDVDCFHPYNVGRVSIGDPVFMPCTPAGVMELLRYYKIDPAGKSCAIIGRSNIVGKPMALLMINASATVTVCNSKTKNLAEVLRGSDIIVSAAGIKGLVTAGMVKPGAVVVDVSMNRGADGKLCGDVDFPEVEKIASYITPVPGGVGPMTIAMLMQNTMTAAKMHLGMGE